MDGYQQLLLAGLAIVIVVVAWWFVRTRRTEAEAPPLLEPGWQLYARPTELEPPGTIFRIDGDQHRYLVDALDVAVQTGNEAMARRRERIQAAMGMAAHLLSSGPKLTGEAERIETFTFEMDDAHREYVLDAALDKVLDPWLKQHNLREGSRYYVIREALGAKEVKYILDQRQTESLGGEAALADAANLEGTLHAAKSRAGFEISRRFAHPMRIFFLPEELRPLTRGLSEEAVIGRRPVTEPLIWKDRTAPLEGWEG